MIEIKCKSCELVHIVRRTLEIPKNVISLKCNWCPSCEDKAKEDYYESYVYLKKSKIKTIQPKLF